MASVILVPADFRALFPQFANTTTFPNSVLELRFGSACLYVAPEVCGDMAEAARTYALYLMTAHLMALSVIIAQGNYTGQPGVVQAATVDAVSVTLQPPPQRGQWRWWLNTTPYGAELIALLDAQSVGGFFTGSLPERAAFRQVGGVFL